MSFILDALRKSEHDRDRRLLPGIIDAPKAIRPRAHLRWVLVLCAALFVLNSIALAYLLLRDSTHPAVTLAASETAGKTASPTSTYTAPSGVPGNAPPVNHVRSLADEALAGSRTAPYNDVPPTPTPAPRSMAVVHDAPVQPARAAAEPDPSAAGLPTRRQLPPALASALPPISVDLHVYSPQSTQRFMVISGQRAQEGATVAGGIVIEKITPDGAIAVFRGTRFLLTRD